ncbi:MAG: hypothetical protein DKT66_08995 [Candidatus Melainabacteria bacterium]|nr:MAG: hypothetical protein DKT66_08995 [Candidatus Melainabacteria bacterium]
MIIRSGCAYWRGDIWRNETSARNSRRKIHSTEHAQYSEKYLQHYLQRSASDTAFRSRDKTANHFSAKARFIFVVKHA